MGFYSRVVFPRLCDWMMADSRMSTLRADLLAGVDGEILEIGFGTGLNLAHYPPWVRRIAAADPNPGMDRLARHRIACGRIDVEHHRHRGEDLPFADATFDCVISTWTLCSIPEAGQALGQVYRVLKPGGRFLFLEHGRSDRPDVRRWQRCLNPIQRMVGDGCRLDLDVEAVVRSQPFRNVEIARFEMERMPRTHGSMYRGLATR